MNRIQTTALCALTVGLLAAPAHAYKYMTCGGEKVTWEDPFLLVQNTFSIAPGGKRESAFLNAVNRWRGVRGMLDMVVKAPWVDAGSTYGIDDGQNDAVVVDRADIGGNNGLTTLISDGCWLAGDMDWVEADVQVASDMDFNTPARPRPTPTGAARRSCTRWGTRTA